MKRAKLGILALAVILVVALVPFGTGFIVQAKVKQKIAHWTEQHPQSDASLLSYHRGLWSSEAKIMLTIHNPKVDEAIVTHKEWAHLLLKNRIHHGPFLVRRGHVTLAWALVETDLLKAVDNGYPDKAGQFDGYIKLKAQAHTELHFTGALTTNLQADYVANEMPGMPQMQVKDLNLSSFYSNDFKKQTFKLSVAQFQLTKAPYRIDMKNLGFAGKWQESNYDFYVGQSSITLDELKSTRNNQQALDLIDFKVSAERKLQDDLLNSSVTLSAKDALLASRHYGPLTQTVALNKIAAPALQKLQQQLKLISQSPLSFDEKRVQLMALIPLLPKLLTEGASFEIKQFDLILPEGQCSLEGYARVAEFNEAGPVVALMQMLPRVTLLAKIQLPVSLVEQLAMKILMRRLALAKQTQTGTLATAPVELTQEQRVERVKLHLKEWENRGLLLKKEGHYHISLSFKEGQFLINNRSLSTSRKKRSVQQQPPEVERTMTTSTTKTASKPSSPPLTPSVS